MSRAQVSLVLLAIAGCAAPRAAPSRPERWWLAERDGLVVLEPSRGFHFEARSRETGAVGEPVELEIAVPGAAPGERHRFRVRAGRPGIRLLGPETVETEGARPAVVRFTSDSAGPGGVLVEALW